MLGGFGPFCRGGRGALLDWRTLLEALLRKGCWPTGAGGLGYGRDVLGAEFANTCRGDMLSHQWVLPCLLKKTVLQIGRQTISAKGHRERVRGPYGLLPQAEAARQTHKRVGLDSHRTLSLQNWAGLE